jgi:hypothetical protein
MPFFFSATRSARSTAEANALMPIFLPLRSAMVLMAESFKTMKLLVALPG